MHPRERDAWIATQIIGAERPTGLDVNPDCPHEFGYLRDGSGNAWWFETMWPPRYTTDSNLDYAVLRHVRFKWPTDTVILFSDQLREIWSTRRVATMERPLSYADHVMYEPGDYATAAFLTHYRDVA